MTGNHAHQNGGQVGDMTIHPEHGMPQQQEVGRVTSLAGPAGSVRHRQNGPMDHISLPPSHRDRNPTRGPRGDGHSAVPLGDNNEQLRNQLPTEEEAQAEQEYIRLAQENELMTRILANTQRMAELNRLAGRNSPAISGLQGYLQATSKNIPRCNPPLGQPPHADNVEPMANVPTRAHNQPLQSERISVLQRLNMPAPEDITRGIRKGVFGRLQRGGNTEENRESSEAASSRPRQRGDRNSLDNKRQPKEREGSTFHQIRRVRSPRKRERSPQDTEQMNHVRQVGRDKVGRRPCEEGNSRDLRAELEQRRRASTSSPSCFASWIESTPPNDKLTQVNFALYGGKTKALDHIAAFEVKIKLITFDEALWCRAFATTFQGRVVSWYTRLPSGSIEGWTQFKETFLQQYGLAGISATDDMSLLNFRQRSGETTAKFAERFKNAVELIDNPDEKHAIGCFISNLNLGTLKTTLTFQPPSTLAALYRDCSKMSQIEERQLDESRDKASRGRERAEVDTRHRSRNNRGETSTARRPEMREEIFTPLNSTREHIMNILLHENKLEEPKPLRQESAYARDPNKRCAFHQDFGHSTEDCIQLRKAIQKLIDEGQLNEFKINPRGRPNNRGYNRRSGAEERHIVHTIREPMPSSTQVKNIMYNLSTVPSEPEYIEAGDTISFRQSELASNPLVRSQPIVVQAGIHRSQVRRILIDTGASRDVLFYRCFRELGLSRANLIPTDITLEGFTSHTVRPEGTVQLQVTFGEGRARKSEMIEFVVLDMESQFNAIMGTPSLSLLELVVSVPHQRVKFVTNAGVGCVRSNARTIYENVIRERRARQRSTVVEEECIEVEVKRARTGEPGDRVYYIQDQIDAGLVEPNSDEEAERLEQGGNTEMVTPFNEIAEEASVETRDILILGNEQVDSREDFKKLEDGEQRRENEAARHPGSGNTATGVINRKNFPISVETLDIREQPEMTGIEEMIDAIINPDYPEQTVKVGMNISEKERGEIVKLLQNNLDIFAWKVEDMQGIDREVIEHSLNVDPRFTPVQQRARQFSTEKELAIKEEIKKLLRAGIIKEVQYPTWLANVVMVLKTNKKWRMCVDFTDLNKACPKDCYPLPRINKLVDSISGHRVLSFVDAYSGYHQVRMYGPDHEKTAFRAAGGTYCYHMMPFGLKNAGATYQRMVDKMFGEQIGRNMEAYVDDMVIKSKYGNHDIDLQETFANLRKHNMKLNPAKCVFGVTAGKFLGFMVNARGIEANPEKIQALLDMKAPRSIKQIQKLNGMIISLGRFISRAAEKCLPFFKALKKGSEFNWSEECQKAFAELKRYLGRPPLLTCPVTGEKLFVYLAATDLAIASVLLREENSCQRPIYYCSHALTDVETRYLNLEKLVLALVITARKLRPYFQAHVIAVYTDAALKRTLRKPDVAGRMLGWSIELTEFDIEYLPRTAVKGQALADFVAETSFNLPEEDTSAAKRQKLSQSSHSDSRPEHHWLMFVDGSSGQTSGAGILLVSPDREGQLEKSLRFKFKASNNQAEYEALIAGLEWAKDIGVQALVINCDSQLVVKQISGEYNTHHPQLVRYRDMARKLLGDITFWEITQIDRSENERADFLSKVATSENDLAAHQGEVEFVEQPAYERVKILAINEAEKSWVDEMIEFLDKGKLPEEAEQARMIKRRSPRYVVLDGILYRRSFRHPLARCVPPSLTTPLLEEVHSGMCGGHPGARTLADKVISQGYYWPKLREEASSLVRRCEECQRFADIHHMPATPQTPVVSSWPFDMWGIDMIGVLPTAPGNFRFLMVAVDYFTKWIEARPMVKVTEENTIKFLHDQVWCRFGMPRAIVSDHGLQFSTAFTTRCNEKNVQHWKSSVARPQGNGQAEAANKLVINALEKCLGNSKGRWVEELPASLWAVRTTTRGPTGETPFALTYGSEAMVPVEMALPTARVAFFDEKYNESRRAGELDWLEEKRIAARLRLINYKQRTKQHHDKRVKPRTFAIGDLVLRKTQPTGSKPGKFMPNWEGPWVISGIVREGTYILANMDGVKLKHPWHADHLKKYYQ